MKNINNFTQWKNESVIMTITQKKHLAQSGRRVQSAVDIFNTLCVFTKMPIREQEIKLRVCEYEIVLNSRRTTISCTFKFNLNFKFKN